MALTGAHAPGATPLTEEDIRGLKLASIATQGELNEAEAQNIAGLNLKCQPFHSANASNAASGNSPAYNLLANARRRSRRVWLRGSEDSMMARAVSNIDEAILMRRSGVMSL